MRLIRTILGLAATQDVHFFGKPQRRSGIVISFVVERWLHHQRRDLEEAIAEEIARAHRIGLLVGVCTHERLYPITPVHGDVGFHAGHIIEHGEVGNPSVACVSGVEYGHFEAVFTEQLGHHLERLVLLFLERQIRAGIRSLGSVVVASIKPRRSHVGERTIRNSIGIERETRE